MYNINFLPQLEASGRYIFGNLDHRNLPLPFRYYPSPNIKIIECVKDTNGEFVPKRELEEKVR